MKTKTEQILAAMNVLSWVVFFGLLVKAGAIIFSYVVSISNPEAAKNLYMGLDLYSIRQHDLWQYTGTVSLMVTLLILEAYVAFLVTRVLSKIKLASPFTMEISRILEKISYLILLVWVTAMLYNAHVKWLSKTIGMARENFISGEFIFLAGVVFIFSQVFKKGVEIQSENELTV
ncbi:DUF2975 domain-containing protein [Foetidibacter luteolus]|uniref:DUF2975 domain-containing protein n=1 Tax=Foetidibacter luteolus TaxID=2608880 RepID=UPI00129B2445|nr:DUF2975 domain-containing protein [Foetidibacter luteolus]